MTTPRPRDAHAAALAEEAGAFDERIRTRVAAGFVPDLRRAVRCEHFYKSFWRDPQFIELYLGRHVRTLTELIGRHAGAGARILDVGCGAGYVALELARAGHHVHAIDIAPACIDVARVTLADNPFQDAFGSLAYEVAALEDVQGLFDVVLCSGVLHHMDDVDAAVRRALALVAPGGHLLCAEPQHEAWREDDAAQVALVRGLLALTGHWYDAPASRPGDESALQSEIAAVRREYLEERDPNESGQSPNDNASTGVEILRALRAHCREVALLPTCSFIYRTLGGLRGDPGTVAALAEFLAAYDRLGVRSGFLRPNGFVFLGKGLRD